MSDEPSAATGVPASQATPPGPPAAAMHRSMEKTDRNLGPKLAGLPGADPGGPPGSRAVAGSIPAPRGEADGQSSDLALIRIELEKKQAECAALARKNEGLRTEIEALRTDYTVQQAERLSEIEALKQVLGRANEESKRLEADLASLKKDNKELKAQNLSLQYHLNLWGIPVSAGRDTQEDIHGTGDDGNTFFPALTPLAGAEDPIPIVLRGDLAALAFPDLLQFLASSKRSGVVTVVTDQIVAKLYIENSVLRLAGWNSRDPELGLLALLEEAELLPAEVCDEFRESNLYDLELAGRLVAEKNVPADTVRIGLREHTRVILSYLFQVNRGAFFFQPGQIPRRKDLQFQLLVTDLLLKTAAEMDEKTRDLGEELSRSLAEFADSEL